MLKLSNLRTLPHTVVPAGERRIGSAPNRNIRYIALGSMLLTLLFLIACGLPRQPSRWWWRKR